MQLYVYTSIEARLWRASLLWRSGTTALQQWWLGDGASSNALSISSFTPMANPVAKQWCSRQARGHDSCPMIAIPCQCSSERMKPSFGKANPQKLIVPLLLLVSHFIAFSATAGGHHAFACLTRALEIEEWFSRLMPKVVPVVTSFSRMYIYRQNLGFSAIWRYSHSGLLTALIPILNQHII